MATITDATLLDLQKRLTMDGALIEAEATPYTVAELTDALRVTRARLQVIADGWTQEQLLVHPPASPDDGGEDRWSATEILTHLAATQNWHLHYIDRILGQRKEYAVMPRGLGDHARQDVPKAALSAMLRAATEQIITELENIPADADLAARRAAPYVGELSIRGWILLSIGHDLDHLTQLQRLTRQPNFPPAS